MTSNWEKCGLSKFINFKNGKKRPNKKGFYPVYGGNGILDYTDSYNSENCIIIGRVGAYCGCVYKSNKKCWISDNAIVGINNENSKLNYIYYLLSSLKLNMRRIGSGQPLMTQDILNNIEVSLPPLKTQQQIAQVLSSLDDKIELNNAINKNLEEQAQAIFKSWFVENKNDKRIICKAKEYFDIGIGRTPSRKDFECFSQDKSDITWVSIADMGKSGGIFINRSSEYLTSDALNKYNMKIIPTNTVILSFKLTVGRVAITDGEMTTNEAIAHFKSDDEKIVEYLYCYLKQFNFQTMGSTSSIATAVNSEIIKNMPFVVPINEEKNKFHKLFMPIFELIKFNQKENERLSSLRDTLLPKLMSGEIDVSHVKL